MNTWGKFFITAMISTGLIACGQNNPVASSQASNDEIPTTKKTATRKNPVKNHNLSIGGEIQPFAPIATKTSLANLHIFETPPATEKKPVTKLPVFRITNENLQKLTNLTLDLSKQGFYEDKIEIESTTEGSPNCAIVAGWKIPNTDETQSVTFKLVFENNELNFSNFEIENLQKIKNVEFGDKVGTTLMCSNLEVAFDDEDKNFIATKVPVTLKVIDSTEKEEVAAAPVKKMSRKEKKKFNRTASKQEAETIVQQETVVQKEPAIVQQPAPSTDRKTTVDGVPLQLNKLDPINAPIASRNDLFDTQSN